jgi:MOSC domain-containing protein YiiM
MAKRITARVVSVHAGSNEDLSKEMHDTIQVALDGIVGDRHRSFQREAWQGDKQAAGTIRRNERQWSAVSAEELGAIQAAMGLDEPLQASHLGANLCLQGIEELSRLPKGTTLKFPSGAELIVEEASRYTARSGEAVSKTAFSKAATLMRGVVGVVEVPGAIAAGDDVVVDIYETPEWLARSPD